MTGSGCAVPGCKLPRAPGFETCRDHAHRTVETPPLRASRVYTKAELIRMVADAEVGPAFVRWIERNLQ